MHQTESMGMYSTSVPTPHGIKVYCTHLELCCLTVHSMVGIQPSIHAREDVYAWG